MQAGRRACILLATAGFFLASAESRSAAETLPVVVSFSILGDMVKRIGGEDVATTILVGPDSDVHVFEPTPAHARALAAARLVVMNGLGLEGWLTRLSQAAGYAGPVLVASDGIVPLGMQKPGDPDSPRQPGDTGGTDPHAWQDVGNAILYAGNIGRGLSAADPSHAANYAERTRSYQDELRRLDSAIRSAMAAIDPAKRRVITDHDAFRYYGRAYGVTFLAPAGISTDSQPSARAIAALLRQIKAEKIRAIFLENATDPRLVAQIARDSAATVGPALYPDALSGPQGPAPSYVAMMQHNTETLKSGMLLN